MSVCWLVGRLVGRSVNFFFYLDLKLNCHAPIGTLVVAMIFDNNLFLAVFLSIMSINCDRVKIFEG